MRSSSSNAQPNSDQDVTSIRGPASRLRPASNRHKTSPQPRAFSPGRANQHYRK